MPNFATAAGAAEKLAAYDRSGTDAIGNVKIEHHFTAPTRSVTVFADCFVLTVRAKKGQAELFLCILADGNVLPSKNAGVPENIVVVELMPLGWPDEEPAPRPRKEINEFVFFEKYQR